MARGKGAGKGAGGHGNIYANEVTLTSHKFMTVLKKMLKKCYVVMCVLWIDCILQHLGGKTGYFPTGHFVRSGLLVGGGFFFGFGVALSPFFFQMYATHPLPASAALPKPLHIMIQ